MPQEEVWFAGQTYASCCARRPIEAAEQYCATSTDVSCRGLCCRWNGGVHGHADETMIFRDGLLMMRVLPQRRGLRMGVAGLRRTHKGDHHNAERRDQPHPHHRLPAVLVRVGRGSALIFRAFNLCSTSWIGDQTPAAISPSPDASKRMVLNCRN